MKKMSLVLVTATTLALPALADYYVAGDFNGWSTTANVMTDLGGNIWGLNLAGVDGRHEFKITLGDWSQSWPASGNSWFLGDEAGNIAITFNANDLEDGWRGNWGRIGVSTDPGAWTAVGDWQGWDNANPATAMTAQGDGLYSYQQILDPGWYQWKAVNTGTWDAIGDDFRSINADTTWFEITADAPLAVFELDALTGVERVSATMVPEPSSLAVLGAGLAAVVHVRRRSAAGRTGSLRRGRYGLPAWTTRKKTAPEVIG